ncbi:hypothetical protein [Embleya sp. NPDC005971]|uniref:hypothetical protein n=1 Tax=Embleya sp. NPDC005971 TaxID=3156724 RepID=UPI0033C37F79
MTTVLLLPVTGLMLIRVVFTPSSCADDGGCRAWWQLSGVLIALSVGIALASWAWPRTRRGNLRRRLNLAAYVAAVVASSYALGHLPTLGPD